MKKTEPKEENNTYRILVIKSAKHTRAQAVDSRGKTLTIVSDNKLAKMTKVQKAKEVGKTLAELLKKEKAGKVVFDRGSYLYHGRVRAVADGLREGGINI